MISCRANEASGRLGELSSGYGHVVYVECVGSDPLSSGAQERVIGSWKRNLVNGDETEGIARYVYTLKVPSGGKKSSCVFARKPLE